MTISLFGLVGIDCDIVYDPVSVADRLLRRVGRPSQPILLPDSPSFCFGLAWLGRGGRSWRGEGEEGVGVRGVVGSGTAAGAHVNGRHQRWF